MRRDESNALKSEYLARVEGRASRGLQRMRWKDKVDRDMKEMGPTHWNVFGPWGVEMELLSC